MILAIGIKGNGSLLAGKDTIIDIGRRWNIFGQVMKMFRKK
jgi:hypothetical protein